MGVRDAWAAGFFEGEGSIGIRFRRIRVGRKVDVPEYSLTCQLNQVRTAAEAVEELRALYGGSLMRVLKKNPNAREQVQWTIVSRQAAVFLTAIRPYVRSRNVLEKIAVALDFQAHKRQGGPARTPEYRQHERDAFDQMKRLNLRGLAALERDREDA